MFYLHLQIGPHKRATDVCKELAEKAKTPAHELCLQECTLGGALKRPLHHAEKILETVARWGYWDPDDRKDNVLILKKDRLYRDIVPRVIFFFNFYSAFVVPFSMNNIV